MRDDIVVIDALDERFCADLRAAVESTTFVVRMPDPAAPPEVRWAASTDYGETFRSLVPLPRVPAPLVEAARRVSGLDEVVPFRAQANVMLAGQGLGRHTDVPEFVGARRFAFPDWLLVAMLHSGGWDDRRIAVVSALVWPFATAGGDLRVVDRDDRELRGSFAPTARRAVAFDTCRLPHDVDRVPGDEIRVAHGDRIAWGTGHWVLERADGGTAIVDPGHARVSVLVKLACFADADARTAWEAGDEPPLDRDAVVAELAARVPGGDASPQRLVDHLVPYM